MIGNLVPVYVPEHLLFKVYALIAKLDDMQSITPALESMQLPQERITFKHFDISDLGLFVFASQQANRKVMFDFFMSHVEEYFTCKELYKFTNLSPEVVRANLASVKKLEKHAGVSVLYWLPNNHISRIKMPLNIAEAINRGSVVFAQSQDQ